MSEAATAVKGWLPNRWSAAAAPPIPVLDTDPGKLSIDSARELANELKSELLLLGDPYVWAQLEYAEPLFLGLVERVAVIPDKHKAEE